MADDVSLPDLWRRDGLAGMRTRSANARRSLLALQDKTTKYAQLWSATASAWAAAAAAFDRSWRLSGMLVHLPDTCPDCGTAEPEIVWTSPGRVRHKCGSCDGTWWQCK